MSLPLKVSAGQWFRFAVCVLILAMVWENLLLVFMTLFSVRCPCLQGQFTPSDSCYSSNHPKYKLYGTHTDYNNVRGHGTDFSIQGCEPEKFYLLSRHGIRYPTTISFAQLSILLPTVQRLLTKSLENGTLCLRERERLRSWKFSLDTNRAELLSDSGWKESVELGVRFRFRFPQLVAQPWSPERYEFQHTYKPRTTDTARALGLGMFGKANFSMSVNPKGQDPLLRFYGCCDKYQKTVNGQPIIEQDAFQKGHEMSEVVENIKRRLGLTSSSNFTFDDVYALYEGCGFESAILGDSALCLVFSTEDLQVLEYWRDLKYYYHSGYGHSINYEQTCDLLKDIMGYLSDNATGVTGMIRVAHDSTLMPLFAKLGLFYDQTPLRAVNMAAQSNRKWRSSLIASFGSNLAFVEYRCGGVPKVRVFHNEKSIALPMCPQSGCKKSDILNSHLGAFAHACDLAKTCEYSVSNPCNGHVTNIGECVPTIIG